MHTYTYPYADAYACACAYTHIHTCTCIHAYIHIHRHMHACMHTSGTRNLYCVTAWLRKLRFHQGLPAYAYLYIYTHKHTLFIYIYTYIHICLHMCAYNIYICSSQRVLYESLARLVQLLGPFWLHHGQVLKGRGHLLPGSPWAVKTATCQFKNTRT